MIRVDLNSCKSFIPLPYEAALAPRLRIAHDHLQKGDGAGGEFTGWVRLPQDYDKEEFARIQPRPSASRQILRRWWSSASAAPIWGHGASSSACGRPTTT